MAFEAYDLYLGAKQSPRQEIPLIHLLDTAPLFSLHYHIASKMSDAHSLFSLQEISDDAASRGLKTVPPLRSKGS